MARCLAVLTAAWLLVVAGAPAEGSSATITVGFGEQDAGTFDEPRFRALGIKRARVVTPGNVALRRSDRADLDWWLASARSGTVEPLVSFSAATGSRCPRRPCTLPTVRGFRKAFRAFRRRYPWVRRVSPWN